MKRQDDRTRNGEVLKKKQWIVGLVVLVALAALLYLGRASIQQFSFGKFRTQFVQADWGKIALGIGCIYLAYFFRSIRWAWLLRHDKKVGPFTLLGTQVIGFTAVALIGRIADPVRPYLVAKKTGLPLSSQIAVYIVERLFDLGCSALLFSLAILSIAPGSMPHPGAHKAGMLTHLLLQFPLLAGIVERFGGLILTAFGALFLVLVRFAGEWVALGVERFLSRFSKSFGKAAAHKILTFRSGLYTMRSFSDFAVTTLISLAMWGLIALAYIETLKAFTNVNVDQCIVLMMASGGASVLQLPIIGWFTQIGIVAAAISAYLRISFEVSSACAATLLLVTFLCIIPVGLIWARFEHVNLRKVAAESEGAEEELAVEEPAG
jgi:uncharacterized membrane protein YbhN (UPF0104 family)